MADFPGDDLTGSRFERVKMRPADPAGFREEWEHRLYAERDLAVLEARQREDADGRSLPA